MTLGRLWPSFTAMLTIRLRDGHLCKGRILSDERASARRHGKGVARNTLRPVPDPKRPQTDDHLLLRHVRCTDYWYPRDLQLLCSALRRSRRVQRDLPSAGCRIRHSRMYWEPHLCLASRYVRTAQAIHHRYHWVLHQLHLRDCADGTLRRCVRHS